LIDKLILIAGLLLCWGFFAGAESAFISVSRIKLGEYRKKGRKSALVAHYLLKKPERLLTTALVGTNISLVLTANLAALVIAEVFGEPKPIVSIVAVTLVSLLVCEILPKNFGIRHNLVITVLSAVPMFVFYMIFFPIGKIFIFFTKVIIRAAGISYTGLAPSLFSKKEDLKIFLKSSLREPLTRDQRRYFLDSLDFSQKELADIMIPLIEMRALRVDEKVGSCYKFVKSTNKFYIPVFKERIDNIVGLIYARDIFDIDRNIPLALIMREPHFVPEKKNINELYRELYEKDIPVVFAVDEHGGVTGMATIYDIGEEVIGRISSLEKQKELIVKVRDGEYLCDGEVEIDELGYLLSIEPRYTDVTTLNGLFLKSLGRIPRKGDSIDEHGYRFIVEKSSRKRAELIRILKKPFDRNFIY
jgi:CBS domain containing-hemolysin-like protein